MSRPNSDARSVALPRVAVVIANHNYGDFIGKAIDSFYEQDYQQKHAVIVDDGSTDNSVAVVESRMVNVSRSEHGDVTILRSPDISLLSYKTSKGPSFARNLAIKFSEQTTDIYAILDADDYWKRTKLSKSVSKFVKFPEVGLVYTDNMTLRVEDGLLQREFREPFSLRRLFSHNMVCSSFAVTKHALQTVGLYDESLRCAEDLDLVIRVGMKFGVVHIPEALSVMRKHNHNSDKSVSPEIWKECWQRIGAKYHA